MANITDKAMLASVTVTQYTGRKHDKKVSQDVAAEHGTSVDVGRYNKVLLAKSALEQITRAAGAVRDFHYKNTLPWEDDGARILAGVNYFDYCRGMNGLRADFDREVARFVANYDEYVNDSRARLKGLFVAADYPSAKDIARRFTFDYKFKPIPLKEDLRINLNQEEVGRIRADIERRTNAAIAEAVRATWQRVHDVVAHMAERLRAYKTNDEGKVEGAFRDTLVANIRDLAELLPRLNVTGDAQLDATAQRLRAELCAASAQDLRDSEPLRAKVATEAERILAELQANMASYTGMDAAA